MFFQSAFRDNTITCSEAREVNLDVLNMLASGAHEALCACSYRNEKGHHHFVYQTDGLIPFGQLVDGLDFYQALVLLGSTLSLLEMAQRKEIELENLKIAREYIFRSENGYRFVYIPVAARRQVSAKDAVLRLISVMKQKDSRLVRFTKELRKLKEDDQVIRSLCQFLESFGFSASQFSGESASSGVDLQSSEADTTVLSRHAVDAEGETSVLSPNAGEQWFGGQSVDAEGETSVLSPNAGEQWFGGHAVDTEGETSVLNPDAGEQWFGGHAVDAEGETSVLSPDMAVQWADDDSDRIYSEGENKTVFYDDESAECETVLLTSEPELPFLERPAKIDGKYSLFLLDNMNGQLIPVEVTPFTIGKDRANMDYVPEDDSVSRHHATIKYEDGAYYIEDNNSTNGTRIEGIRLQSGERAELEHGYMITLGRASFQAVLERRL